MRASTGDILIFTDDDCQMSPDYLQNLQRYDQVEIDTALRGGSVKLGDRTELPLTIQKNASPQRWHRSTGKGKHVHLGDGIILGCNLVVAPPVGGPHWTIR
jgi:hypothetical protein